jgi:hypothetical protein
VSCRGEERAPPEDAAQPDLAAGEAAIDDWPCEKQGYPCTWEEVSAETTERTFALADQALDRFEPGKAAELVAWLEAQPGVAEASEDDPTVVRFRLENGRPFLVQGPLPTVGRQGPRNPAPSGTSLVPDRDLHHAGIGSALIEGWRAASSRMATIRSARADAVLGVTGRDRNADRRVNQRDQRKAIILESMWWEECYETKIGGKVDIEVERQRRRMAEQECDRGEFTSAAERVRRILDGHPAYQGNVKVLRNQQVDFAAIASWADYDVVHIEGHGSRNSLCIGTEITYPGHGKIRGPAAERRGVDPTVFRAGLIGPKKSVWCVNDRFFRAIYPKGLERTLIFVNVCSTLGHPEYAAPPLAEQLLGKDSMYIGWGGVTEQWDWVLKPFYEALVKGSTGREALDKINKGRPIPAEKYKPDDADITDEVLAAMSGGTLEQWQARGGREGDRRRKELEYEKQEEGWGSVLGWRGSNMRIREIVKLLHPALAVLPEQTTWIPDQVGGWRWWALSLGGEQVLEDGDDLESILVGAPEDGEDDLLTVGVEVEAIERKFAPFQVQLALDGRRLDAPDLVTSRHIVREEFGYPIYRIDLVNVPTERDFEFDREYDIEVIVDLPERGESRYSARLKVQCPVHIQGEFEGQLAGGHFQVFERGLDTQAKILLREDGGGIPGFRLPQQFHLDQRGGGRNGWAFNFNAVLDGPVVSGARFRVERHDLMDPSIPQVSGSYRASRGDDAMSYPLGSANIMIHRVRWLENDEGGNRRGMACGEVNANIQGLVQGTYPFQFVPHTFRAKFWAEIRRD